MCGIGRKPFLEALSGSNSHFVYFSIIKGLRKNAFGNITIIPLNNLDASRRHLFSGKPGKITLTSSRVIICFMQLEVVYPSNTSRAQ